MCIIERLGEGAEWWYGTIRGLLWVIEKYGKKVNEVESILEGDGACQFVL